MISIRTRGLLAAGALIGCRFSVLADSFPTPVFAHEIVIKGTVQKVSLGRKEIEVKIDGHTTVSLRANPDIVPLDEIKKGDHIEAKYLPAIALSLEPTNAKARAPVIADEMAQVSQPQDSAAPAVVVVNTAAVTAEVEDLDKNSRTVTLRGPQGTQLILAAGSEIEEFNTLKIGDRVRAHYTLAVAIEVHHVQAAALPSGAHAILPLLPAIALSAPVRLTGSSPQHAFMTTVIVGDHGVCYAGAEGRRSHHGPTETDTGSNGFFA